ncbi:efflux RND transporter periplasmic adaptor subunit [Piscinibacter sp.]|uniref:efflux RND transporter periplasmic adaptor subunit n=1 Tax=Piscinibacter sp. TaxID=1903157 RepID=UPI002C2B6253|nr:efflux RND transporter periplasmic adaptor subunit [Albitalea sp.]HUG22542.1 efflux RND transporter periplasmic adaptor subunit [Albitalea sp.]
MPRHLFFAIVMAFVLAACGKAPDPGPPKPDAPANSPVLLLGPEDMRTLGTGGDARGPVITGSIQPERRADLRAEVSAVVLQVLKENGESVRRGDLLVRLDDTAIRDSLSSAEESARASARAFEQAERQVQRLKTLQAQGMTSIQALEDAEVRRNNAQSDLAAAKARVVAARQQMRRTEVRAPFDGVVSDRQASAGDTAAVGKELVKVIDPASMRLEGRVSSDRMHEIKIGQDVYFKVNGYPNREFVGRVKRVDATANPITRQVEVLVEFADDKAPKVAGLYAEGRIASGAAGSLMLPESSVVRSAGAAYVWQVKDKTITKVPVQLGERDPRVGEYRLLGGLAEGDRILRNPGNALVDGQKVEYASAPAAAVTPSPAGS